jgi:hypothetical protein
MKRREEIVLAAKDVPPVPMESARAWQYPAGTDLNGEVVCCNCGKTKPVLKTKYITGGKFKCKKNCKGGNSKINHETSQPAKRSWIITIPAMVIEIKEGT